jgi:type II secretory pathway pseudopilin PulG
MKHYSRGITITELIFILVLFTVLSFSALPVYTLYVNGEREKQAQMQMQDLIAPAIQHLYEDTGTYPPSKMGDDPDLVENEDHLPKWQGPYLKSWPTGPPGWTPPGAKGAYQYRNFYYKGYHTVVLWCYGPNKVPETDITSGQQAQGDDIVLYLLHTKI